MSDTGLTPIDALTVKEVAHIFGVDHKTVYGWIYRGEIPCIRIMFSIRIPRSAVQARSKETPA